MTDMNNLKKLSKIGTYVPKQMELFQKLNETVFADGELSKKTKELIALAVALTTQCGYCLEIHREKAIEAGASEAEISETAFVAAALRAGAAITHATELIKE